MTTFSQKIICPFCFCSFAAHEIRFRCLNPVCLGKGPDPIYATIRGYGVTTMGRMLVPVKRLFRLPREVECDICYTISHTRICPDCHFELPQDIGQIDQRIIAIIGGRATGKSHYIASLINMLQNEAGQQFGLSVRMLGDHTQERWEHDFYAPLFIHKTVLQPTQPAEIDPTVKSPLIFRFIFGGDRKHALNMSFFDSAGEDMNSLNTMSIQNRYITHADGIIFLLDPLQIPGIRPQLRGVNVPAADPKASPEHIVGRLLDLFEHEHHLHAPQQVKTPIAFTLSKVDTLTPLLNRSSALRNHSKHTGYLDLDDVESVNTEIENYMTKWINPNFGNIISNGFASYSYFGVSSLGKQPDSHNHLSEVSPLRVEDPFLWLLYKFKLIRGKKRR